ncbi:semaphorin-2A isoform X1 [Coccinella septempunctata]|uniref:semaphorin-2A isoform X1 n=1 Tax=Coccinella septempunctata TaxID=41139 RepID=UPI001D0654B8|nr:semaphorin-2A isoform X1 [Coccinella septempunctata]
MRNSRAHVLKVLFVVTVIVQTELWGRVNADFENSWTMYLEQPCCSGTGNHHVRHHRDHVREFTCGQLYYRTFHLDAKRDSLYVGAMGRVFRLNLSNINSSNCERDVLNLEPTNVAQCVSKGKSEHFDCRNHIRVIQSMGDGKRLYICGTNAHNPKDWVVNANLTHIGRNFFVPGIGLGIAKCPYDPADNSTAVWVEHGNPGDLPGLYSGTNAEFTKADTVIFRTDLHNLTTGRKEFSFKRTIKYDSKWLDKPNFVGSFDIGDYVLFFFRETAVEYINCGKSVYSRVARVCKKDTGGKNILSQNWATYLKARLNCSIPGEFPFYFNEIQSIYRVPGDNNKFYGTFTTSTNGLMGSAICSFTLKDIHAAFAGKFKEQASSSSAWLPVLSGRVPEPRPGTCVNNTETLPDSVLNFIRSHPLMDSAVQHEHEKPVFFKRDIIFTKLVVDKVPVDIGGAVLDYTVYYAGTNDGRVHKIVEWQKEDGDTSSILLDVFDVTPGEAIQVMEISKEHKAIYVASDLRIKQVDLVMCNRRYDNCLRCVHDPYCGWDKDSNVCKPYSPGLLQDVSNSTVDVCDSSVVKKKMIVTWGQSLHLGCFLKMPTVLSSQTITWYHYSKDKGRYKIQFRPEKYIETSERGLVIIAVTEADAGRYDCSMGASLLCSYNVTVDAHRCAPPAKTNDYQKIYSDWCHEFEKYKSAMKTWERKQAQCASRQNDSNQNNHPNEIYRPLV